MTHGALYTIPFFSYYFIYFVTDAPLDTLIGMKLLKHEIRHWERNGTRGFVLAGTTGPDTGVLFQGSQTQGSDIWELQRWSFKTRTMRPVKNQDIVLEVLKFVGLRD